MVVNYSSSIAEERLKNIRLFIATFKDRGSANPRAMLDAIGKIASGVDYPDVVEEYLDEAK